MRVPLILALLVLTSSMACTYPRGQSAKESARRSNALRALFEADQAERSAPIESVDTGAVNQRDSLRRDSVRVLVAAGPLRSASDFYHPAMIFQHGRDSLAYGQAHVWARRAE